MVRFNVHHTLYIFFVKSLHRKRTKKIRENTLDKKQIYRFFFVKSLHPKRSNKKELKKFTMNTILDHITDLDHICLRMGGSRFEMKYIGCFGCTGNKMRLITWEIGDRFVSLTQRFLQFVLVEEIEKPTKSTNHYTMIPFSQQNFQFNSRQACSRGRRQDSSEEIVN